MDDDVHLIVVVGTILSIARTVSLRHQCLLVVPSLIGALGEPYKGELFF